MTRRELARHLSRDITAHGPHYSEGSTVWCTPKDEWGAYAGLAEPPPAALFYAWIGWDQYAERNTVFKIETALKRLEAERTGKAKRVQRKGLLYR